MQTHKQSGAAAVEFAMIAVLLITLIVAIAGFGFLFWMQQRLSQQAGDVARTMMVSGSIEPSSRLMTSATLYMMTLRSGMSEATSASASR